MKYLSILLCWLLCVSSSINGLTEFTVPTFGTLTITDTTEGSIVSPGYPFQYPNNVISLVKISASGSKVFRISASSFNVEEDDRTSCYDYVALITTNKGKTNRHVFCGASTESFPTAYFVSNQVQLYFRTDMSTTRSGFKIHFEIYDQIGIPSFTIPSTGVLLLGDVSEGYILSPNYPSLYPNGVLGYIMFSTTAVNPKSKIYKFTSDAFDVENSGLTCNDEVTFQYTEAWSLSPTKFGPFCGKSFNNLLINNNEVTMRFESDSAIQHSGFKLHFRSSEAAVTPSACGVPAIVPCLPKPSTNPLCPSNVLRIIGGTEAFPNSYPWQALLMKDNGITTSYCGATIIHPEWLLTSAVCLKYLGFSGFAVRVGVHQWNLPRVDYPVKKVHIHPQWNNTDYNVALVNLHEPLFFNSTVSAVCLDEASNPDYTGQTAIATGWGRMDSVGLLLPTRLQEVSLKVLSATECTSAFKDVTPRSFCASETRKGICYGDVGGPFVVKDSFGIFKVIGISSGWSSLGCKYNDKPSVFTKVSAVSSWISGFLN